MPFTRRQTRLASQSAAPESPQAALLQDRTAPSLPAATPKRRTFSFLNSITQRAPKTPKGQTFIKPAETEMHPGRHHQTSTTPYDEARWLGFFNMGAQTAPAKKSTTSFVAAQTSPTPVKVTPQAIKPVPSPAFEFTFRRAPSVELSEDAQKIMEESRAEAARIRAQLASLPTVPDTEPADGIESAVGRKIAKPKGKVGRFSDVHLSSFKKMDSIANHASAWRADPNRTKATTTSLKRSPSKAELDKSVTPNLKRSLSKAELDKPTTPVLKRTSSKVELRRPAANVVKRSPSKPALHRLEPNPFVSRTPVSDSIKVAAARMQEDRPAAPSAKRIKHVKEDDAGTARHASQAINPPTSFPRTPAIVRSKSGLLRPGFFSAMNPTKASLARTQSAHDLQPANNSIPLVRSTISTNLLQAQAQPIAKSAIPRSKSMKNLTAIHTPTELTPTVMLTAPSPAPSRIAMFNHDSPVKAPELSTPENSPPKRIKSILRTPNRRYTRDPLKIAAGTHLATPPKQINLYPSLPTTEPMPKRVVFTNSTKDKAERDAMKAASVEPEPVAYPDLSSALDFNRRTTLSAMPTPGSFTFRSDQEISFGSPAATIRQVQTSDSGLSAFSPFNATQITSPSKRKLETVGEDEESEKENRDDDEEERPAKKARVFSSSKSAPTTPARKDSTKSRLPMFGSKRTSGLTAARLSMLARPKRRA